MIQMVIKTFDVIQIPICIIYIYVVINQIKKKSGHTLHYGFTTIVDENFGT